jgi:putative mRNA 3-end processing factor
MLKLTEKGLYCQAGNFYIDPKGAVQNAIITHAHSDHARRGSEQYICARSGVELLRARLGKSIQVSTFEYGEVFKMGKVQVSFHPAGHILGSAQVRLEYQGEVWVISGDYKRDFDPTCEAFESVACDVFITEATFGTPSYRWAKSENLGAQIFNWWQDNAAREFNSVLMAYSLGKTQRVLGLLEPFLKTLPGAKIYCPQEAEILNHCYREQKIPLAPTASLAALEPEQILQGELIIAPASFLRTPAAKVLGEHYETAFASGWTAQRAYGFDRGFLLSDHADWDDLVRTIQESKAKKVYVQHRGKGALVKYLRSLGVQAFPEAELMHQQADQLSFLS